MNTKIEFIKERFYRGKKYNIGDILSMPLNVAKTYINARAAKYYKKPLKKLKPEEMPYKKLQELCKRHNLKAVGSKQELIDQLKEKGIFK